MSETQTQEQPPADANVGWQELKSEKGEKFRVKASDYDISDPPEGGDAPSASGPKFNGVSVNWRVGTSGNTSSEVRNKTAITWYKLEKAPWWSIYTYRLSINCEDTYNYRFYDEEPDNYDINVWNNAGTHTVEFKSERPTIVSVSGT